LETARVREIMMREMLPLFRTIVKGKEQGVDGKANIMAFKAKNILWQ